MQTKPANWDAFFESFHTTQYKAIIDGLTYESQKAELVSIRTTGALYDKFSVGNCVARSCEIEFYPKNTPAKQAQIQLSVRLEKDGQVTSYIPKGTFFFSRRNTDASTGVMKVTGYDAMLKTDGDYIADGWVDPGNWPRKPSLIIAEIAERIGVAVDPRTVVNDSFLIPFPSDDNGVLTMRDLLSNIATAEAGNFIITEENKLLLVSLSASPETNYLINEWGYRITFGGDRILV